MSKTVQDRVQRCLTAALAGYAYAGVLGEAASRLMHDFMHRERGHLVADATEKRPRGPSIEDLLRLGASDLEQRCEAMAEADAALERSRAELCRCRARRDRDAKHLYEVLTWARRFFKSLLGYPAACKYLGVRGPTPRDPHALLKLARDVVAVLADADKAPEWTYANSGRLETSKIAERLVPVCDDLAEAVAGVTAAYWVEVGLQEIQRRRIADFDRCYRLTARLFEQLLDHFGLPTLASTVRPGVKRRGRPPKTRVVDFFPDLVEQVLGRDALEVEDASEALARIAGVETDRSSLAVDVAVGLENASAPPEGVIPSEARVAAPKTGETKSLVGLRKPAADDQKSETGRRKSIAGDQKSRRGPRKQTCGDSKSETGRRKLFTRDEKSETGARKLETGELSSLSVAITRSRKNPDWNCRVDQGVEPLARRRSRRRVSSRLAASATVWWRRIRGVSQR